MTDHSDTDTDVLEDAAREGAKALTAFFKAQDDDPELEKQAKAGLRAVNAFVRAHERQNARLRKTT